MVERICSSFTETPGSNDHHMRCKDEGSSSEGELFSHEELMAITTKTLNELLKKDSVLSDLPSGVTLEEVTAQIAVQHGQSMTVYVTRYDGEEIPVIVHQIGSTVLDLKRAIKRFMTLRFNRLGESRKISWRSVWRRNHLAFDGKSLDADSMLLADAGIRNKSSVTFMKRLRVKSACKK